MDFSFTPEQEAYRARLRAWLSRNLPAGWGGTFNGPEDPLECAEFRKAWERRLHAAGYAALHWPREYGGQGLSVTHTLILHEELGRVAAPEPFNIIGIETAGPMLLAIGTPEQKARHLPRIVAVEECWCQGFTEPEAGSDLTAISTRAERDGDAWVVNGRKIWTSQAHAADYCCLLARTDPAAKYSKGITVFAVPMKTPGIHLRPLAQLNGRAEFNEILFENARIPLDSHLGPVNEGWRVANEAVAKERAMIRLYRQARFQNEFEHMLRAAAAAPRGRRLTESGDFRQKLAVIHSLLRIHRYHNLKLIARLEAGETIGAESSIVRLFWSEMRQRIGHLALDVLGPDAVLDDAGTPGEARFQDVYLMSRADTIFAGTAQIQRNVIAERVLGLPR
ncbi:MAG: acyl-CoA dehydrogenase family protein [Gammaproteobacteria bacterium]